LTGANALDHGKPASNYDLLIDATARDLSCRG